jgi:hypothetical protein
MILNFMHRFCFIFAICVLVTVPSLYAQKTIQNIRPAGQRKVEDYPNLKTQANDLCKATLTRDFGKMVDYTYPKLIQMLGGRDKMVARLSQEAKLDAAEGFVAQAVDVDVPIQIEMVGKQLFAVMPITVTAKTPNGIGTNDNWLIGISIDDGRNWTFIRGVEQKRFDQMFPDAAGKITIPAEPK